MTLSEITDALHALTESQLTAIAKRCHQILVTRCVQRRADDAAAFNAAFRAPAERQAETQD
jgi:hypothetical protein